MQSIPEQNKKSVTGRSDPSCPFCEKVFKRETALEKHICEQKKRWLDRDMRYVRLGYAAYEMWCMTNIRKKASPDAFRKSKSYGAFTRFGKFIIDVNAIEPKEFIKFVVNKGAGLPVDKWSSDPVYETYIRDRTSKETPNVAAERTLRLMEEWSVDTGLDMKDFFRRIETPLAVHWIRTGRISPWLLYATESGQSLLDRLNDEQIGMIGPYINPTIWSRRLKLFGEEVNRLTSILSEAGI